MQHIQKTILNSFNKYDINRETEAKALIFIWVLLNYQLSYPQ